jgi:Coenzyme PQQ synthesis protein D (PqqD)
VAHENAHLRTIVNQDGAALLDTVRGKISTLNTTGAYIWLALQRGESEEEIVDGLARETGESPDMIRQDANDFIASLHEQQILNADARESAG